MFFVFNVFLSQPGEGVWSHIWVSYCKYSTSGPKEFNLRSDQKLSEFAHVQPSAQLWELRIPSPVSSISSSLPRFSVTRSFGLCRLSSFSSHPQYGAEASTPRQNFWDIFVKPWQPRQLSTCGHEADNPLRHPKKRSFWCVFFPSKCDTKRHTWLFLIYLYLHFTILQWAPWPFCETILGFL